MKALVKLLTNCIVAQFFWLTVYTPFNHSAPKYLKWTRQSSTANHQSLCYHRKRTFGLTCNLDLWPFDLKM